MFLSNQLIWKDNNLNFCMIRYKKILKANEENYVARLDSHLGKNYKVSDEKEVLPHHPPHHHSISVWLFSFNSTFRFLVIHSNPPVFLFQWITSIWVFFSLFFYSIQFLSYSSKRCIDIFFIKILFFLKSISLIQSLILPSFLLSLYSWNTILLWF